MVVLSAGNETVLKGAAMLRLAGSNGCQVGSLVDVCHFWIFIISPAEDFCGFLYVYRAGVG